MEFLFSTTVKGIEKDGDSHLRVRVADANDDDGDDDRFLRTKRFVNACGLDGDVLTSQYDGKSYDVNPRRGQFLVYDRRTTPRPQRIILPAPDPVKGKGKLVLPTVFGNVLAGPTSEDLDRGLARGEFDDARGARGGSKERGESVFAAQRTNSHCRLGRGTRPTARRARTVSRRTTDSTESSA